MKVGGKKKLLNWVSDSVATCHPDRIIESWMRSHPQVLESEAILCWGKAAMSTWERLSRQRRGPFLPTLVIAPIGSAIPSKKAKSSGARFCFGEHPIPGPGSLRAGGELLDFLASLRRMKVRRLRVFLSGGASSLAWVPPAGYNLPRLQEKLNRFYRAGLDIRSMNRERAKLCALKAGGSARWLECLSPGTQVRVEVISDVLPFEPLVVGSGPFWDGRIPHRILADNRTLLNRIEMAAKKEGAEVLIKRPGWQAPVQKWCDEIQRQISRHRDRATGDLLFLYGGEPAVRVRKGGMGGRLSHLGAMLALSLRDRLDGIEILGFASDGVDGKSGAAGFALGIESDRLRKRLSKNPDRRRFTAALRDFDSASSDCLGGLGVLIPTMPIGTNVQDVVSLRIIAAART